MLCRQLNDGIYLLTAPSKKIWTDYDKEAGVLYISFYKPQKYLLNNLG